LEALDNMSSRTYDTVFVYYVKSGQQTAAEILSNVTSRENVHPAFLEFLLSLGWPVDVKKHPGWTGHSNTSWKVRTDSSYEQDPESEGHGGSLFSGHRQVLYWSDFSSEMAFVVPRPKTEATDHKSESADQLTNFDRTSHERHSMPYSGQDDHTERAKPRTLSLDLDKTPMKEQESPAEARAKKFGRQYTTVGLEMKMMVMWLESFEDHSKCPINDLLLEATTGCEPSASRFNDKDIFVIFVHALQSGLYRIHIKGQTNRLSTAIPLMDGMIVSRRVLGTLIRQTTLNMCRRKRLENDGYQPPHVRRKLKIQEIANKYGKKMSEAEFYASLFQHSQ